MQLTIPPKELPGILEINQLSEENISELINVLESIDYNRDIEEFSSIVSAQIKSIPSNKTEQTIRTLDILYKVRDLYSVKDQKFIEDLLKAIKKEKPEITDKELESFDKKFTSILDIDSFKTHSKASILQRDGEKIFLEAKTLSDIRPVFGLDPSENPLGAVITHTLKINYDCAASNNEFHIVLDLNDLKSLKEVVDRALQKDKTLKNLISDMDLKDLEAHQ